MNLSLYLYARGPNLSDMNPHLLSALSEGTLSPVEDSVARDVAWLVTYPTEEGMERGFVSVARSPGLYIRD